MKTTIHLLSIQLKPSPFLLSFGFHGCQEVLVDVSSNLDEAPSRVIHTFGVGHCSIGIVELFQGSFHGSHAFLAGVELCWR